MKEGFVVLEEIKVPSNFDHLAHVESLIDRACSSIGVSEDNYGNVLIAVTEAFNNAVMHGNKNDANKEVKVVVGKNTNEFCFIIEDQGIGFDYDNIVDPTAPENLEKESGRGIYLMRHLADEVDFDLDGRVVSVYFKMNG